MDALFSPVLHSIKRFTSLSQTKLSIVLKLVDNHVSNLVFTNVVGSGINPDAFDLRYASHHAEPDHNSVHAFHPKYSNVTTPTFRKPAVLHSFGDRRYHMTSCDYPLLQAPSLPLQVLSSSLLSPSFNDSKVVPGLFPRVVLSTTKPPHNSYILFCQEMNLSPKKGSSAWKLVPDVEKNLYKKRLQILKSRKLSENEELNKGIESESVVEDNVLSSEKVPRILEDVVKSSKLEDVKRTNALLEFKKECNLDHAAAKKKWKAMNEADKKIYKVKAKKFNELLGK